MRHVVWTRLAAEDLEGAISYLADRNPEAARQTAGRIIDMCERLGQQSIGRRKRIAGTFEKIVERTPYIVAYEVDASELVILRVIHVARNWTPEGWPKD